MFTPRVFYFIFFLYCYHSVAFSQSKVSINDFIEVYQNRALDLQLAQTSDWHLLLRLYSDNQSEVQDADFFLSVDSRANSNNHLRLDPQAELSVLIQSLFSSPANESHPICVFPMRSRWVIERLQISTNYFSNIQCRKLSYFLQSYRHDKVSVLFMDEKVNTIPNMMGHIGLRLHSRSSSSGILSQDKIVTYVTILHSRNPFSMLYGALVSGSEGRLGLHDYDNTLSYYLNIEGRSVWEYELNMNASQVEILLLQLWELKNLPSRYTYLSYNCVTPLFDLMRVADSRLENKISQQQSLKYWYSPLEYMQFLSANGYLRTTPTKIHLSEKNKNQNSHHQVQHILNKQKTSRLSIGYEENDSRHIIRTSFDLHGSLLSDHHRTDFTEYELQIMGVDVSYDAANAVLSTEEINLYAVKYLPSFDLSLSSLSWQAKLGGQRYISKGDDVFSPHLLMAAGLANRINEHGFVWSLLRAQYIHQLAENYADETILSSELGMILDVDFLGQAFKSTAYYWHYFDRQMSITLPYFQWVINWKLNQNHAINLSVLFEDQPNTSKTNRLNAIGTLSMNYFF